MDYEKKFEDFLGRMQGLLDNAKKQGHIIVRVEDLENTFPELAESEDDRIKKALIRFHKSSIDIDGIKGEDIIAWLEKQAGKDKLIQELGKYKVKYTQEILSQQLKKQGEQKPKWCEEDEKCIDNCCLLIGAADNCYEKTFKDDCIHYLQNLKKRMGV